MIAWHELDACPAAAVRADLAKWADEVLFPAYPSARDSIRECWLSHPDAVTEVSLIWLEHRRIYQAAHPPLADSLVLFDRWLPGVLRRVRQITDRCTGIDGCTSIRPGNPGPCGRLNAPGPGGLGAFKRVRGRRS